MRSKKKGIYFDNEIKEEVKRRSLDDTSSKKDAIVTKSRNTTITPDLIGYAFKVHNGKTNIHVNIVSEMIGHKLGEFALTRKFKPHTKVAKDLKKKVVRRK